MIETPKDDGPVSRQDRRSAQVSEHWPLIEPRLIAALRRRGVRLHDAQDIAQETAQRVLQKTDFELSSAEDMLRFAHYVASCLWKDAVKKASREQSLWSGRRGRSTPDVAVEAVDRIMSIEAWHSLSPRDQEALAYAHLPPRASSEYQARYAARKQLGGVVKWLGALAPVVALRRFWSRATPGRRVVMAAAAVTAVLGVQELTHTRPMPAPSQQPSTTSRRRAQPAIGATARASARTVSVEPPRRVPTAGPKAPYRSAVDLPKTRVPVGPRSKPWVIIGTDDAKENEPVLCYGVVPVLNRTICVGNSTKLEEALGLR